MYFYNGEHYDDYDDHDDEDDDVDDDDDGLKGDLWLVLLQRRR